jgi:hypothetical protein
LLPLLLLPAPAATGATAAVAGAVARTVAAAAPATAAVVVVTAVGRGALYTPTALSFSSIGKWSAMSVAMIAPTMAARTA